VDNDQHHEEIERIVAQRFAELFPPGSDGPDMGFDIADLYQFAEEEIITRGAPETDYFEPDEDDWSRDYDDDDEYYGTRYYDDPDYIPASRWQVLRRRVISRVSHLVWVLRGKPEIELPF
jgi:hypothetical protein